jgi:hypothetical protein
VHEARQLPGLLDSTGLELERLQHGTPGQQAGGQQQREQRKGAPEEAHDIDKA